MHFGSEGTETEWYLEREAERVERVCVWLRSEQSRKREGRQLRYIYQMKRRGRWRRFDGISTGGKMGLMKR